MTRLPSHMADRWRDRAEPRPGQGMLYWHILLGDSPQVRELASTAREKLASFSGLHFTPERWLHVTALVVGPVEEFTEADIGSMVGRVRGFLTRIPPLRIALGKILYHPEAIALGIEPTGVLDPVRDAVHTAVMNGQGKEHEPPWVPHITLAYSTSVQPSGPIIATLGRKLPECDINVDRVNLIIQEGAERLWNWRSIAEVSLGSSRV